MPQFVVNLFRYKFYRDNGPDSIGANIGWKKHSEKKNIKVARLAPGTAEY
ncbi:Transposase [Caenorhabditis elegans]|uniref:Transposase n=1 Tax=Caenorhabditis elegans TaxID=6239 RepID=Q9TZM8_CAEEL|nr:Transposase [Caenorhabditis elegans]CCD71959.1 Transposase [Caenorhabditis elegans]|eukprot:NP_508259.1 Uncharacterized protein CELE_H39E20.1 [Caenorhabditis elegans]